MQMAHGSPRRTNAKGINICVEKTLSCRVRGLTSRHHRITNLEPNYIVQQKSNNYLDED
jgi:hypothetical protein